MMAPKPQQMQSRKDRLKTSISRRRALLHGQSREGVMKEPPVAIASFQKAGAAKGSPSMGNSKVFTVTPSGQRP